MNKFKKILATVLVGIVLLGGMVFGAPVTADSATLTLTTNIESFVGVKVIKYSESPLEVDGGKEWFEGLTNTIDSAVTVSETGGSYKEIAYLAYYANIPFTLTVKLPKMSGTGSNTYTIGYEANIGLSSLTADAGTTHKTIDTTENVSALLVETNINYGEYNLAPADTYSATMTFEIEAQ